MSTAPTSWLKANGAEILRTTYADLFSAITFTNSTIDTTSASAVVTMNSTADIEIGYYFEGDGISVGTTVVSVDSGTQLTLSQNATGITARFLPFGQGNGSTSFGLPDLRGEFVRGWDDGRGVDSGRAFGSFQADEIKSHRHGLLATANNRDNSNPGLRRSNAHGVLGGPASTGGLYADISIANGLPFVSDVGGVQNLVRNVALLACIKH